MPDLITVEINCPDAATALRVAEALLARRLVAAANIHAPIISLYHWRGALQRTEEVPLILKTRASLFDAIAAVVGPLHPYETPSLLARPVLAASDDYRAWLLAATEDPSDPR